MNDTDIFEELRLLRRQIDDYTCQTCGKVFTSQAARFQTNAFRVDDFKPDSILNLRTECAYQGEPKHERTR